MDTKLIREVKFWNENGKWCVAYTAPEFEFISDSAWNKDLKKADEEALAGIKKRIKYQQEFKRMAERSEVVIKV